MPTFSSLHTSQRKLLFPILATALLMALVALISLSANSLQSSPTPKETDADSTQLLPYSPEELEALQHSITKLLSDHGFNGSVLVARKGMVICHDAFGYADFRNQTPVETDTPFQLASISKTFTATAVLMLHEEGLIDIDNRVDLYIPEFPYPQMTVRHLLNHTSGIQNYMWLVENHWKQERFPSNEDVLNLFVKHNRAVNFAAGTRFEYSNTGYAILALLIEKVSGQRFAMFLNDRIFEPLGMSNTFVYDPENLASMPENRAFGFRPGRRSYYLIGDVPHDAVQGDKGVFSTINDLYRWDQAIYRHELLSEKTWDESFANTILLNENTINYGLGWRLQTFLDQRVVHHPGRWNGFRTSFKRFIDDKTTFILLSNNNKSVAELVDELQNMIFSKEIMMLAGQQQDNDSLPDAVEEMQGGTFNDPDN